MNNCPICSGPAKDAHFGSTVYVCRACSAFFRRFVLSPKSKIKCQNKGICKVHYKNTKNCRSCRMKKCLAARMNETAVQGPRDRNKLCSLLLTYSSSLSPSDLTPDLLPRLNLLYKNYLELDKSRQEFFQKSKTPKHRNIIEMIDIVTKDMRFVEKFIRKSYSEVSRRLSKFEKKSLFQNYFIKHVNFESPFRGVQAGKSEIVLPNGDFMDKDVGRFYTGHIKKLSNISKESMKLFFKHYWEEYNRTVVNDVQVWKPDVFEFLAVSSLMFWDIGLEDFSQKSVELCRKMRNEIISEISVYYKEVKKLTDPCIRLGEIMLLLLSIQKSFTKCQEELEMCGFYKIYQQMHSDAHQMINDSLSL